jgi:hypothetical protein
MGYNIWDGAVPVEYELLSGIAPLLAGNKYSGIDYKSPQIQ